MEIWKYRNVSGAAGLMIEPAMIWTLLYTWLVYPIDSCPLCMCACILKICHHDSMHEMLGSWSACTIQIPLFQCLNIRELISLFCHFTLALQQMLLVAEIWMEPAISKEHLVLNPLATICWFIGQLKQLSTSHIMCYFPVIHLRMDSILGGHGVDSHSYAISCMLQVGVIKVDLQISSPFAQDDTIDDYVNDKPSPVLANGQYIVWNPFSSSVVGELSIKVHLQLGDPARHTSSPSAEDFAFAANDSNAVHTSPDKQFTDDGQNFTSSACSSKDLPPR